MYQTVSLYTVQQDIGPISLNYHAYYYFLQNVILLTFLATVA